MRFTSCIPALDMLTVQFDPLSKPVGPVVFKDLSLRVFATGGCIEKWRAPPAHLTALNATEDRAIRCIFCLVEILNQVQDDKAKGCRCYPCPIQIPAYAGISSAEKVNIEILHKTTTLIAKVPAKIAYLPYLCIL